MARVAHFMALKIHDRKYLAFAPLASQMNSSGFPPGSILSKSEDLNNNQADSGSQAPLPTSETNRHDPRYSFL